MISIVLLVKNQEIYWLSCVQLVMILFTLTNVPFLLFEQYHGGTNFGRTAGGPFITTSYDYDAPIDEYGQRLS